MVLQPGPSLVIYGLVLSLISPLRSQTWREIIPGGCVETLRSTEFLQMHTHLDTHGLSLPLSLSYTHVCTHIFIGTHTHTHTHTQTDGIDAHIK